MFTDEEVADMDGQMSIDDWAASWLDDDTQAIERRLHEQQEAFLSSLTPEQYQTWLDQQAEEHGARLTLAHGGNREQDS